MSNQLIKIGASEGFLNKCSLRQPLGMNHPNEDDSDEIFLRRVQSVNDIEQLECFC